MKAQAHTEHIAELIKSTEQHCHFVMKAPAHTKRIAELIKSAKQQFGDFSEDKKQEIFLTIKEAKVRGLLRKQPHDRCLSEYINARQPFIKKLRNG
jgi:uncharacterized protein YwgA